MRLTELDPRWFTLHGWSSESQFLIGLTFKCPHCGNERIGVLFDPPIDPDGVGAHTTYDAATFAAAQGLKVWRRAGDSFETLTLTPSVDGSGVGHWHGSITNGDIT